MAVKASRPVCQRLAMSGGIFTRLDRRKRLPRSEQSQHVANGKCLGMEAVQGDSKLQPEPRGIQRRSIRKHDANAVAALAGVTVRAWREGCRLEANARDAAAFEISGESRAIDPRRADEFERGRRAPAHADVGLLDEGNARIDERQRSAERRLGDGLTHGSPVSSNQESRR